MTGVPNGRETGHHEWFLSAKPNARFTINKRTLDLAAPKAAVPETPQTGVKTSVTLAKLPVRYLRDPQLAAIGYFAKISSTRLKALSAAACGVAPSLMISAHAACQTCSF